MWPWGNFIKDHLTCMTDKGSIARTPCRLTASARAMAASAPSFSVVGSRPAAGPDAGCKNAVFMCVRAAGKTPVCPFASRQTRKLTSAVKSMKGFQNRFICIHIGPAGGCIITCGYTNLAFAVITLFSCFQHALPFRSDKAELNHLLTVQPRMKVSVCQRWAASVFRVSGSGPYEGVMPWRDRAKGSQHIHGCGRHIFKFRSDSIY